MHDKNILINLIDSVKNHSKLYRNLTENVDEKNEEWKAVAQECSMSFTEAQRQWSMVMKEYIEYLKNNQEFALAKHMDFLQPYFFVINDKQSIDEIELLNAISSKNFEETKVTYDDHLKNENTELKTCSDKESQFKTEEEETKKNTSPNILKNTHFKTLCISDATPSVNLINNMSSLELIFLGYAKQLQKMPTAMQLKIKRKVAEIMDEAELEMIKG